MAVSSLSSVPRYLALISYFLPMVLFILLLIFLLHIGGFTLNSSSPLFFDWHPLFQLTALILLPSYSILFYRVLPLSHASQKWFHALFHYVSLVLLCFGTYAVFQFHDVMHIPDLKTPHSWAGVFTIGLFLFNILAGSMFYLLGIGNAGFRKDSVKYHRWLGISIYFCAAITAVGGLIEKVGFLESAGTIESGGSAMLMANAIEVLIVGLVLSTTGVVLLDSQEHIEEVIENEDAEGRSVITLEAAEKERLIGGKLL